MIHGRRMEREYAILAISAFWCLFCLTTFVDTARAEIPAAKVDGVGLPGAVSLMLGLAALFGIASLRWLTLRDAVPKKEFRHSMIASWVFQSLASLAMLIVLLVSIRPLALSIFLVLAVIAVEQVALLAWFFWQRAESSHQPVASEASPSANISKSADVSKPMMNEKVDHDAALVASTQLSDRIVEQERKRSLATTVAEQDRGEGACEGESELCSDELVACRVTDYRDRHAKGQIEGFQHLELQKGERLKIVHVPFVPAFPTAPKFEAESDCEELRVTVTHLQSNGARLEIRRTSADAPIQAELAWAASCDT